MSIAITLDNLAAYVFQSTALILAALGALWALRLDAPGVRYLALRVTLAAALLLPLLQPRITVSPEPFGPVALIHSIAPGGDATSPSSARLGFHAGAIAASRSTFVLTAVLVAGIIARLLWLGLGLWRLQLLRRLGETGADEEYDDLQKTIGTRAELRYVTGLGQPLTFGFRVPVILLPDSLRRMAETTRRAVIAHELWHVRRRDWLFMVGEEAIRAAFWFHPAMWLLLSRIQVAREETVDELAVLTTGSRRAYLDALLAFADTRSLFGTTAFARRRHLIHRMLMLSKESVMSPKRIVASCSALLILVGAVALTTAAAFPLAQQTAPRDPPPPPPPGHEMTFVAASEAELQAAIARDPKNPSNYRALANHYVKAGDFDRAIATLESLVLADPNNPQHPHMIAVFYWEKATRDTALTPSQKVTYLNAGIAASDRALAISPAFPEAMIYKNILLRTLATYTPDTNEQRRLTQEADTLRNRAVELNKSRQQSSGSISPRGAMPPPPPPPPPPFGEVDGVMPVRAGGTIPPPAKIKEVRPEYPPIAMAAGVTGTVVIEAVIATNGRVRDARVLRSIPLLDEAALEAVNQWEFAPTRLNNVAVPVIVTLTIDFRLQ
jgi:TonB family protein